MIASHIVAAEKLAAWLLFIGEHINPCGHLFDYHGGLRYSAKVLINRAATGLLKWWMFPNAILGKPLPVVSTIDSSDLIPDKGGLQEGWRGVLVLGSEASDIAPGDALTID